MKTSRKATRGLEFTLNPLIQVLDFSTSDWYAAILVGLDL